MLISNGISSSHFTSIFSMIALLLIVPTLSALTSTSNSSSTYNKHHHRWIGPSGHRVITVDVNGLGDFQSVQAAVDSVPFNNRKNVHILISAGYYMTVLFGVYRCWGPGVQAVGGVSWAQELDFESAHPFLVKSFVNGWHWIAPSDA